MNWEKIKIEENSFGNTVTNVPFGRLLVSDGDRVEFIEDHGWDKEEYYFYKDDRGKLEGITHFMILPTPPEE